MRIDVVTLFPQMLMQASAYGVTGRARERGLWQLGVWNPRDFATDAYRTIDDRPYGGGPGMRSAQRASLPAGRFICRRPARRCRIAR